MTKLNSLARARVALKVVPKTMLLVLELEKVLLV
jgi:hypothetical protein